MRCCPESSDRRPAPPCSISGSDYIAAYFSRLGFDESGTFAVGIVDTERVSSGYQFTEIRGTELPFPDGRFDFIISNHVIKHFAGREQLPFLGWLPRQLAHRYLRLTRNADSYEWCPLSRREILRLLQQQGFQAEDVTLRALRLAGETEKTGLLRSVSGLPAWFWRLLRPVMPTLFFVCTKRESGVQKAIGQIGGD